MYKLLLLPLAHCAVQSPEDVKSGLAPKITLDVGPPTTLLKQCLATTLHYTTQRREPVLSKTHRPSQGWPVPRSAKNREPCRIVDK